MPFRPVLFWLHLAAGLVCGLVIAMLCFTGTALAFEKELIAWAERDARQVAPPPPGTPRLSIEELAARLRAAFPDARPGSMVVARDPLTAVAFPVSRTEGYHANPYTGEVRRPASFAMGRFMQQMLEWHRYLGFSGEEARPRGRLVTGIVNSAFCFLAVTGLYLWMPRTWSWPGVKAIAVFNGRLAGKARDFNWHNAIGFWCAPILIVLTLTAVPLSFQWGANLIYHLVGEEPPAQPVPGQAAPADTPAIEIKRPSPDARPLAPNAILANVQRDFVRWELITVRTSGNQRSSGEGRSPPPFTVTLRETGSWPRTATTTLTLNPFTGEELKREGYADLTAGRQIRSWTRFLHTGQALGWPGQLVAGLACLGGCFLAYTGFALSWRRFFFKKRPAAA